MWAKSLQEVFLETNASAHDDRNLSNSQVVMQHALTCEQLAAHIAVMTAPLFDMALQRSRRSRFAAERPDFLDIYVAGEMIERLGLIKRQFATTLITAGLPALRNELMATNPASTAKSSSLLRSMVRH